jgi:uncharacterized membrane protein HdeD (DUF308 family)
MSQHWTERFDTVGAGRLREPERRAPAAADDVRHARTWLRVLGIVSLAGGLIALVVPAVASVTVAILVGWVLIVVGASMLAHELRMRGRGHRHWADVVKAVLTELAGICLVAFPLTGTLTLTFLLAAWLLGSGGAQVAGWWQARGRPLADLLGLNGIVSMLLGVLIAVSLPSSAAWAIGLLVGVDLIFFGVRTLFASSEVGDVVGPRPRTT